MDTQDQRPTAGPGAPPGNPPETLDRPAEAWRATVEAACGDAARVERFRDNVRIVVPAERVYDVLGRLRDAGIDMLIDITAVDYLEYPDAADRFGVVYALLDTRTGERLFVKTFVNDPAPALPSAVPLWPAADWLEREVFDMFGIAFDGHPDLRRILMPEDSTAHPLRKDYPLRGRGERHAFPVITRAES